MDKIKETTIKKFIKLLEQEELPVKQLLVHFMRFSQKYDDFDSVSQIIEDYKQHLLKQLSNKEVKQLDLL